VVGKADAEATGQAAEGIVRRCARVLVAVLATCGVLSAAAGPRSDYLLHCGGCHLEDGSGNPPEVPDLRRDLDWLARSPEGRSYLTRVPGASQVPISDARLAAVFNWILATYSPDRGDLQAFSAEEVSRTRSLPLYDPLRLRHELTQAHHAVGITTTVSGTPAPASSGGR
jgi:hypothetical protein